MHVIANPLASLWRMIGLARLTCCRICASVKVLFSSHNANSACRVLSNLTFPQSSDFWCRGLPFGGTPALSVFFGSSEGERVTLPQFRMNLREKFVNSRSTWTSLIDFGVSQSSIVEMRSDSMPTRSEVTTNPRKPTSETRSRHFSALQ